MISIYLNFLYNKRVQRTLSGARKIDSIYRRRQYREFKKRDVRSCAAFDFEKLYFFVNLFKSWLDLYVSLSYNFFYEKIICNNNIKLKYYDFFIQSCLIKFIFFIFI